MVRNEIIEVLRRYFVALESVGIQVGFGVLFGSHARGESTGSSDIDVIVVSSVFDNDRGYEPVDRLWITKAAIDHRIEPVPCGLKEWESDDSRAIVEIARREGMRIDVAV